MFKMRGLEFLTEILMLFKLGCWKKNILKEKASFKGLALELKKSKSLVLLDQPRPENPQ